MISVCIATYNGEKYIQEQLMSILPQLGAEDEVIVSDDASSDNTLQIINDFHDNRIHILHHIPYTKHSFPLDKPTHNFENALQASHGDIIFLADQDDIWLPNKVSTMLKALEDAELAIHDCQVVDQYKTTILPSYFQFINVHQGVMANIIKASYLGCCMAFKRNLLLNALPFPPTMVGHDLWLGIVADMNFRTKIVHSPLLLYRKHNQSQTSSGTHSNHSLLFKIQYRIIILYHTLVKYISK